MTSIHISPREKEEDIPKDRRVRWERACCLYPPYSSVLKPSTLIGHKPIMRACHSVRAEHDNA